MSKFNLKMNKVFLIDKSMYFGNIEGLREAIEDIIKDLKKRYLLDTPYHQEENKDYIIVGFYMDYTHTNFKFYLKDYKIKYKIHNLI